MKTNCRYRLKRWTAAALAALLCFNLQIAAVHASDGAEAQIEAAMTLAESDLEGNSAAIRILLEQCIEQLGEDASASGILQSILLLLDAGTADAETVAVLLQSAAEMCVEGSESAEPQSTSPDSSEGSGEILYTDSGLPVYVADSFIKTIIYETILVDVPQSWGNNDSGSALTSYSPVNDSGAISPSAGTLTISYSEMLGADETEAFDNYEKNLADMSVTSDLTSQDTTVAALPARQIAFTMTIGANQYTCETVCFSYNQMLYSIELMQGQQSEYDYFSTYGQVVDSAEVGTEQTLAEARAQLESQPEVQDLTVTSDDGETEDFMESPDTAESQDPAESEASAEISGSTEAETSIEGDLGGFQYEINGHVYQFPTAVSELVQGDLPLDLTLTLAYNYSSDADMVSGTWTELANTECYYFESAMYKEILGVSNMKGYPVTMSEGMLTALVDTQGTDISITLAGGIRVGSAESEILNAFPEFAEVSMDGIAAFRGNELLYACNVREDGCNGYVLIRNDDPYYSALSVICENGVIKEISFECLGSVRADGVFL